MAMWWGVNTSRGQQEGDAPTAQQAATITFQQTGETVPPPSGPGLDAQAPGIPVIQAGSGGSFADQWSSAGLASDQTQLSGQPSSGYTGSHNPFGQYTSYGEGGGGTVPRQRQLDELEQFSGQFANKFNIPAFGESPFQAWQERQYAPTLAAFKLGSAANPERTFEDYLSARGLMGARQDLNTGYENLLGSSDQGAAAQARESIGKDAWDQLVAARLRAKRGQFFGEALANRVPDLERQYMASPEGFEAPNTYGFMRNIYQKRFFDQQFQAVQNQFMGRIGQMARGGQDPSNFNWTDFLGDYFSPQGGASQDWMNQGQRRQGAARFNPPTQFNYGTQRPGL